METQSIEKGQRFTLGSGNVQHSESSFRKLSYFLAFFWLVLIIVDVFFTENEGYFEKVGIPALYGINGLLFFYKAHFELSPTSKYAPHLVVSDQGLKIKTGVFKKSVYINWDDVKKIELGYYKIGIKENTGLQYFPYKTRKETSIELKKAIQAIAEQKGIEVENLLKR
ncbi:MAG: hypothetical protein DSY77_09200 [Bacteroidetes bacterium]|nr:MAG: hypothetical protein DSY77_09200 [Bacteroidota bacterium]